MLKMWWKSIPGVALAALATAAPKTNAPDIASLLGWQTAPVTRQDLCGGHYKVSPIVASTPNPASPSQETSTLTTHGPIDLSSKSRSVLIQTHAVIKQPGRIIQADQAKAVRDAKTQQLKYLELKGHVNYEEANHHVLANTARLYSEQNLFTAKDVIYHLYRPGNTLAKTANGFGTAKTFRHARNGVMHLTHATYSSCNPKSPAWTLHASQMWLNKKSGWGTAHNLWMSFYDLPIFYSPYFTFPINNKRKSGFLTPQFGNSTNLGWDISLPYYLNLATNYDATITPNYLSKHGWLWGAQFRFLTQRMQGSLNLHYIFDDKGFQAFKNNLAKQYTSTSDKPYLKQLNATGNGRGYFQGQDTITYDKHWSTAIDINYVRDPYYFQQLTNMDQLSANPLASQLLNQVDTEYSGTHWHFTTLLQAYQTLHVLNQPAVSDQYMRLPEMDLNAQYPNLLGPLELDWNNQFVNFNYPTNFVTTQPNIGQRLHFDPTLRLPIIEAAGYITPEITLDNTDYNTQNLQPNQTKTQSRTLPLYDVDAGVYFDQHFSLFHHHYQQTIEPRAFYLYVPYQNQSNLPLYDTTLLPFSYGNVFAKNAYSGLDRIQNANQLGLGISDTIYDSDTGAQKLNAGIGMIDYFSPRKVCETGNTCTLDQHTSPIAGQITYYPWADWSVTGQGAWDTQTNQLNNASGTVAFNNGDNTILSLGYTFVAGQHGASNSDLLSTGAALPLGTHWQTIGYAYYNAVKQIPQTLFGGLQYNSCGWAARFIARKTYLGNSLNGPTHTHKLYDTGFYVQILFNGLGSFGSDANNLVSQVPGFTDSFAK